jgi:hypothetical protein
MKPATAAALAILSSGSYLRADLYDITLQNGAAYHFTSFDVPITAAIHPAATTNTYLTGLTITRGETTQAVGLDVQEMELTIAPQPDHPGATLIGGYPLMQAARLGLLDGASVLYSKLFMSIPAAGASLDTSPKAVAWFQGSIAEIDPVGRFALSLKVASGLQLLTVQMPRNNFQSGCAHTVYDLGCTLLKSAFTVAGAVASITSRSAFTTNLTAADHYFDLGVLTFTSGPNAGFSATVKTYLHAAGSVQVCLPFPETIVAGNAFSIHPGCDRAQATCTGKFSNLAHFKGVPYIPVAETLYDGGTSNPATPNAPGRQAGAKSGSAAGGSVQPR